MMKLRNIKTYLLVLGFVLSTGFLNGCGSQKQNGSKSMEEIQKENGLPVVVEQIKPRVFEKYITFFGKFKGFKETTVGAMIGGRIDHITVQPGAKVKKDQIIIRFPEDAPASQYQQAKAAYENSRKSYQRMKALYEKGEIAQAQFDGIQTRFKVDKRNYEIMKDMLQLDAPYSGVVTEIMVHEGDNVKAKTPLFTIAQLNKMKIRIWLSDSERKLIQKGMKVLATTNGRTYPGYVSDLSLSVDPMKQAFSADLIFDNPNGRILPGLTADVKVVLYKNEKAIVVPRNLVRSENSEKYVFLAVNGKAKRQNISIKNESGIFYEIDRGLTTGDSLIIKGNARLTDGIKINVVK